MAIAIQRYNLDIVPNGAPLVVDVHQNDSSQRQLEFSLYSSTGVLTIPNGATASVEGMKPDGKGFAYDVSVSSSGVVTVNIEEQMVVLAGDVPTQIKVLAGGTPVYAANFILRVQADVIENIDMSETDIPSLVAQAQQAALEAQQAAANIDDTWFISGANSTELRFLHTTNKTVVGAINELLASGGGIPHGQFAESDLNDAMTVGVYYVNPTVTTEHLPVDNTEGWLEVFVLVNDTLMVQRFTTYNGDEYIRYWSNDMWMNNWVSTTAVATRTDSVSGSLQMISKKCGKIVSVNVTGNIGTNVDVEIELGTLPAGWRPAINMKFLQFVMIPTTNTNFTNRLLYGYYDVNANTGKVKLTWLRSLFDSENMGEVGTATIPNGASMAGSFTFIAEK